MLLRICAFLLFMILCIMANDAEICHENECYPRIFVPTEEFQEIKEGQDIPAGLHIRINMETGEKEAKLNDPTDNSAESETINLNAIQIIDEPKLRRKRAMQSYEIPSRGQQDSSSYSEQEIFNHAYELLLQTDEQSSEPALETEISSLESLAHDREYGIRLVQPEPLNHLLLLARNNVGFGIRQCAARTIGSSLWNNPDAIEGIKGSNTVKQLVEILKGEKHGGVRASLIFALSAAAAGENGMQEFLDSQGSQTLREAFLGEETEVQGKCATFVEDNIVWNRALPGVDEELSKWCQLFQQSLQRESTPIVSEKSEKVLSSLIAIKREASKICTTEPEFLKWLADNVVAKDQPEGIMELLKEARHMFGNPKAGRKTAWEDDPLRERDEL